jgi:hypothetical protein
MAQAPLPRRAALTGALALTLAGAAGPPQPARGEAGAEPSALVEYHAWTGPDGWESGAAAGVRVDRPAGGAGGLLIDRPVGTAPYADPHTGTSRLWEYATWISPEQRPGFGASELVPSWNAGTPPGTWIEVELRGTYGDGTTTPWYVLGRWASGDADILRTSVGGQGDGRTRVATDTVMVADRAAGPRLAGYRLRVTLRREPGSSASPYVRRLGVMASDLPDRLTVPPGAPGEGCGVELAVPRYSQEVHQGQYPQYDNGGEAWCSPTSSQMVVEYWGLRPSAADLSWVDPSYADPSVDHAARHTYDHGYRGCGNWPFNTAYAASYGLDALVTRLRSLVEAERLVAAGIPVITSQSFAAGELAGAGYGTAGHLMVVVGFTEAGDVIANDPAAPAGQTVRRVYPRRQFETVWLRTQRRDSAGRLASGSGGVCYLLKPPDRRWPTSLGLL